MRAPRLKVGEWVKFKDGDPHKYKVYGLYPKSQVSLGLRDFPDTEQDYTVSEKKLTKVKKK